MNKRLFFHHGDLGSSSDVFEIIERVKPDEVYNLGGQSHVGMSFEKPELTGDLSGIAVTRLLEAIRKTDKSCRFFQASSSDIFGSTPPPQSENSPFYPRSPYAVSKLYGYWATVNYREVYGIHASNGILFNHESPRRGDDFVTKKITKAVAAIAAGHQNKLSMGNLDSRKDWGFAPDYVECMWLMLDQNNADDYIVGSGQNHSVKEFLSLAFEYVNLDWQKYVEIDPKLFRPSEVSIVQANNSKVKKCLGWSPRISFDELVFIMMDYELTAKNYPTPGKGFACLRDKGFEWTEKIGSRE